MLRFYPKTEKEFVNGQINTVRYYQACDCGRGAPTFGGDPVAYITAGNCEFCRYKSDWMGQNQEYTKFQQCIEKRKCEGALYPMIQMGEPLNEQWNEYAENPDQSEGHYWPTPLLRQVVIEGQPLYIQFHLQINHPAQCNAFCFWHNWRLQNKKTWRQCGYSKKCLNDGSGYALMAPTNSTLRREFAAQF